MLVYIFKRILSAIPLIIGLLTITFFVIRLAPGDPVNLYIESDTDPKLAENLRAQLGLNDPIPIQYVKWVKSVVSGDFGISFRKHRPVIDVLADTIPNTLLLTAFAFLLNLSLGVFVGTMTALFKGTLFDRITRTIMLVIYSMPEFWLGLMLMLGISLKLDLLPVAHMTSPNADQLSFLPRMFDIAIHMILPVCVLGISSSTVTGRFMRGSMLDIVNQDYIRTARAKGLSEVYVFGKHAMRNAIIPIVTLTGLSFPFLLGGAVIVETVFAWPGMGYVTIEAIFSRDYPLVIATTFVSGIMVIFGNMLSDVLYAVVDPRIRLK